MKAASASWRRAGGAGYRSSTFPQKWECVNEYTSTATAEQRKRACQKTKRGTYASRQRCVESCRSEVIIPRPPMDAPDASKSKTGTSKPNQDAQTPKSKAETSKANQDTKAPTQSKPLKRTIGTAALFVVAENKIYSLAPSGERTFLGPDPHGAMSMEIWYCSSTLTMRGSP